MGAELHVINSGSLTPDKRAEIDDSIEKIIMQHKGNRQEINRLVFESVAAMTAAENSSQELASKSGLKRFLGGITGSNKRLQDDINSNRAIAQYTSQQTLQRLAEQNLMSFDLITAVNNKLNASVVAIEEEFNEVYRILGTFFKQTRSDLIQLENRVERLERNVNLLNWQNSIEYQMFNGVEYAELDLYTRITCLVRDFYDITKGQWTTSDLLLLKTAMTTVGISPKENVNYFELLKAVVYTPQLREYLLPGVIFNRTPETYMIPLLGIKKLEALDNEESYVVDSIADSLVEQGVNKNRTMLCEDLTCKYLNREAQVNLKQEFGCYDIMLDLLFNLDFAYKTDIFSIVCADSEDIEMVDADEQNEKNSNDVANIEEAFFAYEVEKILPILFERLDQGDYKACYMLYRLENAQISGIDYNKLLEVFRKGAKEKNPLCQAVILRTDNRSSSEKSEEYAICKKGLRELAENNDYFALFELALCSINETDEKLDYVKAIQYFEKAAAYKSWDAYFSLALRYDNGQGVSADWRKANEYYLLAAEMGHQRSQYALAYNLLFFDKSGLYTDDAIQWAIKSFEGKNIEEKIAELCVRNVQTLWTGGIFNYSKCSIDSFKTFSSKRDAESYAIDRIREGCTAATDALRSYSIKSFSTNESFERFMESNANIYRWNYKKYCMLYIYFTKQFIYDVEYENNMCNEIKNRISRIPDDRGYDVFNVYDYNEYEIVEAVGNGGFFEAKKYRVESNYDSRLTKTVNERKNQIQNLAADIVSQYLEELCQKLRSLNN